MSLVPSFSDWMLATRPKSISDPAKINVQSTRRQYYLLRDILGGLAPKEYVQAGSKIVDFIQLKSGGSYRRYLPTDQFSYLPTNTLTQIEVPFRFTTVDMTWTDHETILNGTDPLTTYKRVKDAKESAMMVDFYEGMEDDLWATPDKVEMEDAVTATTGRRPYSLRCFLTDDGLAPSSTNGGVVGSNWTTIQTVSTSAEANWRNQVSKYDGTSNATVLSSLIGAFDDMWLSLGWQSPETSQKYFQDTNWKKMKILVSKAGYKLAMATVRNENDRLSPEGQLQVNGGSVAYGGIPLKYITELDNVDSAKDTAAIPIPRFRWFNFNYIKPIFHSQRYLYLVSLGKSQAQPMQNVELRDTWRNLFCINRRAHGMVTT